MREEPMISGIAGRIIAGMSTQDLYDFARAIQDELAGRVPVSRLPQDQPDPLARYDGHAGDLVPGYADSPDGLADAADQARMDGAR
jgi:hypothetical protein